jgi:hypothetical protein
MIKICKYSSNTKSFQEEVMEKTVEYLNHKEKTVLKKIYSLQNKINNSKWSAFMWAALIVLSIASIIAYFDIYRKPSFLGLVGDPHTSKTVILFSLGIFCCIAMLTIGIFYAVFKPRNELREKKLAEIAKLEEASSALLKLQGIRDFFNDLPRISASGDWNWLTDELFTSKNNIMRRYFQNAPSASPPKQ